MRFHVTRKHIKEGRSLVNGSACPVALAIKEKINGCVEVTNFGYLYLSPERLVPNEDRIALPLPEAVQDFVNQYDNDNPVTPFTFELPID